MIRKDKRLCVWLQFYSRLIHVHLLCVFLCNDIRLNRVGLSVSQTPINQTPVCLSLQVHLTLQGDYPAAFTLSVPLSLPWRCHCGYCGCVLCCLATLLPPNKVSSASLNACQETVRM